MSEQPDKPEGTERPEVVQPKQRMSAVQQHVIPANTFRTIQLNANDVDSMMLVFEFAEVGQTVFFGYTSPDNSFYVETKRLVMCLPYRPFFAVNSSAELRLTIFTQAGYASQYYLGA